MHTVFYENMVCGVPVLSDKLYWVHVVEMKILVSSASRRLGFLKTDLSA